MFLWFFDTEIERAKKKYFQDQQEFELFDVDI